MFLWYKGTIRDDPAIWYRPKHPRPGKPMSWVASVDAEPKTTGALFEPVSSAGGTIINPGRQKRDRPASQYSSTSQTTGLKHRLNDRDSEIEVGNAAHDEPESNDISENMWAAIL